MRILPRVIPERPGRPAVAGPDHPMRKVTRQIAFEPAGWDPTRAAKVRDLFDGLAADWHKQDVSLDRGETLRDALDRGGITTWGLCVEVGSGVGLITPTLTTRFDDVLAVDLAMEMLLHAPAQPGYRVRADGAALPLAHGAADAVVLVNAFLFPHETTRVLAPDGAVVWVNTLGDATPIHMPADDVARALGDGWDGVASEAGWGAWAVFRRSRRPGAARP